MYEKKRQAINRLRRSKISDIKRILLNAVSIIALMIKII